MTNFVNQTIADLKNIIEIIEKLELNDTETLSYADSLLADVHHSLRQELNRKIMEDSSVKAFISNLEKELYKETILTVL